MAVSKEYSVNSVAEQVSSSYSLPLAQAILTHYLHNNFNGTDELYGNKGQQIIDKFISKNQNAFIGLDKEQRLIECLKAEVNNVPFPGPTNPKFHFIDLFAGVGGFRLAMQQLGGKCVYSSEWDKDAQQTYYANFGEMPFGDITQPDIKEFIPSGFDLLCAGFPCQPFSKGGFQQGFEDTRGTLFFDICQIVEKHKPRFLLLENVANLATHDQGNTYRVIARNLKHLGYTFPLKPTIVSPDSFGVPMLRPRVYIPCVRNDLAGKKRKEIEQFQQELEKHFVPTLQSIDSVIDHSVSENLSEYELRVLEMWDEFYQGVDIKVIGFPVWAEFFGFDGSVEQYPLWKATFIQKNRELYLRNQKFIDTWLEKHDRLEWCTKTHRKFEWQAGDKLQSVFQGLIQFRPSGVRVKLPDKFSTLVAMNHRQIIGKLKRKITLDEAKLLQSFPHNYRFMGNAHKGFKQLGNSVNVTVVQTIFRVLLENFE